MVVDKMYCQDIIQKKETHNIKINNLELNSG